MHSSPNISNLEHLSDSTVSRTQTLPISARPFRSVHESRLDENLTGTFRVAPAVGYDDIAGADSVHSSFDDLWPQNQPKSLTRPTTFLRAIPEMRDVTNRRDLEPTSIINELDLVMNILCRHIPHSVSTNTPMRASYFSYVLSQCERLSAAEMILPYAGRT